MLPKALWQWTTGITGAFVFTIITSVATVGQNTPDLPYNHQSLSFQPKIIKGNLETGNDTLDYGSYYQVHTLAGKAGDKITIKLTSNEFDAYLYLFDPEIKKIAEDDNSGGENNAQIVAILAKEGNYTIIVTSNQASEVGNYTLSWQPASSKDIALAEAKKLNQQLLELYQQGKYAEAISIGEQALAIRKKITPGDSLDLTDSLNNLAALYRALGRYREAEPLYFEALEMIKRLHQSDHADVAISLNNLGLLYQSQGKYSEAEVLLNQALAIHQRLYPGDNFNVAISLNNLGALYRLQGQYSKAEPIYAQALGMMQRLYESDHPNVAISLNNLALLYQAQGKYSEAEVLINQALEMTQRLHQGDHPDVVNNLNNLAGLYQTQGKFNKAESLYAQALEMYQRLYEGDHPNVAHSLNNLAGVYVDLARYSEAQPLYTQALEMYQRLYEDEHPNIAVSLNNLAELYKLQGKFSEAEPLYMEAVAITQRLYQEDHPDIALTLDNLAGLYKLQSKFSKAEPLYQKALGMRQRLYQGDHSDIALTLNNLAGLYKYQGKYDQAELLFTEGLQMQQRLYQDAHPYVATSLHNLALLYWSKNNYQQALQYLSEDAAVEEKILQQNLAGSQAQKQIYLATFSSTTDATVSLHLQYQPNNLDAANLALTTILRRKGRVLDSVANTLPTLRQRLDISSRKLFDQLTQTHSQLSNLIYRGIGNTPPEQYQQQVQTLSTQAEKLEAKLAARSAEFKTQTTAVTITAVQKQIPQDGVLVEFIRYYPFDASTTQSETERWGQSRYAVYLLFPQGKPQAIDLGEAATIDSLINEFRRQLVNFSPEASPAFQKRANRQVKKIARQLDQKIMEPVRQLLGETNNLLISPDSQLNLIPFDALVDENDQYLVENYSISYLISGRDLLRLKSTNPAVKTAVIIANPDYETRTLLPLKASVNNQDTRSADLNSLRNCCVPLPGTQLEAEAIGEILPESKIFTQDEATKTAVKRVNAPTILHIASHGFFLPTEERKTPSTNQFNRLSETTMVGENPLLRSGLALAGFNPSMGQLEGALTALEVSGLNLWGTKLVVLSACSTAVGDIVDGEGVYGLRRALVIAGSESQLISLWNVSDVGTKDLMTSYYKKLITTAGTREALRQTQLELLQTEAYSHPFYWAAFILSGNWNRIDSEFLGK